MSKSIAERIFNEAATTMKEEPVSQPISEVPETKPVNKGRKAKIINSEFVNVRKTPEKAKEYTVLCKVRRGDTVIVDPKRGDDEFAYITLNNGQTGYISRKYISEE